MFNFGFSELLVIGVIALIFIGPKQLPEVARVIGRLLNEFKRATGDITGSFVNARNEADDFLKKTRDQLTEDLKGAVEVDVFEDDHTDPGIDELPENTDPGIAYVPENTDPHIEMLPEHTDPNIEILPEHTDPFIEVLPEHTDPGIDISELDEKTADVYVHGLDEKKNDG